MPVFTANIPGLLKVGDRIEIGGKIKENARKMSVNLCAQEGEEPKDVVLHFDVRFHRDNIISLSRKNGIWIGSGNYDTNYNMFVPGTIFRIVFEVKDTDVITIYCQGKFHSNFLPKIPLSMARFLVAWADVDRVTHCFFHLGGSKTASGEDIPPGYPQSALPTVIAATAMAGEQKRCSRRARKKLLVESQQMETTETSEDMDNVKPRAKADRYFYESLMCQPPETSKLGSPTSLKCRREMVCRSRTDCRRKYQIRNLEMGKNNECLDSESLYSEELASKNMDSSSFDGLQDLKLKKHRRSKFALAQVVNFMNKSKKN